MYYIVLYGAGVPVIVSTCSSHFMLSFTYSQLVCFSHQPTALTLQTAAVQHHFSGLVVLMEHLQYYRDFGVTCQTAVSTSIIKTLNERMCFGGMLLIPTAEL